MGVFSSASGDHAARSALHEIHAVVRGARARTDFETFAEALRRADLLRARRSVGVVERRGSWGGHSSSSPLRGASRSASAFLSEAIARWKSTSNVAARHPELRRDFFARLLLEDAQANGAGVARIDPCEGLLDLRRAAVAVALIAICCSTGVVVCAASISAREVILLEEHEALLRAESDRARPAARPCGATDRSRRSARRTCRCSRRPSRRSRSALPWRPPRCRGAARARFGRGQDRACGGARRALRGRPLGLRDELAVDGIRLGSAPLQRSGTSRQCGLSFRHGSRAQNPPSFEDDAGRSRRRTPT